MTKLATFAALAAIGSTLLAQSAQKPSEFTKKVAEVSGGPAGINLDAPKEEHESQLASLRELIQEAPDQTGRDAANANICILLALTGQEEEAEKVVSQIEDRQTREKRRLHITKITKGKQAALDELNKLLQDPATPEQEQIVYIEKFVSTLKGQEKFDLAVSQLATDSLQRTQFNDTNARVGSMLVKYLQKSLKEGTVDEAKLREALGAIVDVTPVTPKTHELINVSKDTLSKMGSN